MSHIFPSRITSHYWPATDHRHPTLSNHHIHLTTNPSGNKSVDSAEILHPDDIIHGIERLIVPRVVQEDFNRIRNLRDIAAILSKGASEVENAVDSASMVLDLLPVALELLFDDCVRWCVNFLEAVPWTEEEENRVLWKMKELGCSMEGWPRERNGGKNHRPGPHLLTLNLIFVRVFTFLFGFKSLANIFGTASMTVKACHCFCWLTGGQLIRRTKGLC